MTRTSEVLVVVNDSTVTGVIHEPIEVVEEIRLSTVDVIAFRFVRVGLTYPRLKREP